MFGLGWDQIIIILLVGIFLLGPERIPTAVQWVTSTVKKLRSMAAGAQEQLRTEIGPELDELRRQIAELQSLKEIQELRDLKDLHPRRLIGRNILGDDFPTLSGGLTGLLGLGKDGSPTGSGVAAEPAAPVPQPITEQPLTEVPLSSPEWETPVEEPADESETRHSNGSAPGPALNLIKPTPAEPVHADAQSGSVPFGTPAATPFDSDAT